MTTWQKVLRQSLGFMSVIGAMVVGGALLALVGFGNAALAIYVTPWLLILGVPAGLVVLGLGMALVNALMEQVVEWGLR